MGYDRDLSFQYYNPTKIVFGENSVNDVGMEVEALGGSKALVVTDKSIKELGLAERVEKALGKRYAGTYDGCIVDSGVHTVNEGAAYARELGADAVVSVGGGSVIDTAKGIAILIREGGQLLDYCGLQMLRRPVAPHVAIPTTSGTGSEVTYAAVIKDWDRNVKLLFGDYFIIPNTAILDPTMTQGMPPGLTATTGMDAFTHAVEAIHALQREPISDGMALHAIRLLVEYLPRCVENGSDLVARGQVMIAATMAGVAFSNAQIGLVHAMAHSVGALFKVPHGLANSILLPHVMLYNMDECPDRYALVAQAMGLNTQGMSDLEASEAAINAIWELTKKMNVPQRLREAGVPEDGLLEAANLSLSDGCIVYNPKPVFDAEEVLEVYKKAW
ncbi:MAG TPA: iron-containing alcohol dehydrogenase [Bacillota bacterium]|jgi:alcohol dehydrogenase class IV|nr:iron-containing alcohol dehydrogenase [Bacillota bacterium]HOB87287.1 iron-containing alcohol dehydrogenase [Bacillota bacterium]HOP69035.1 iron-containing alcohol dehydrogenase [Bacillota bacterium]HPT33667.1 iron-containing alcohol dehydrogenase [Bacillota bacterium]HQD06512.1 iron-containing alcohol dehydrogenase [Bacillota bacterium]